MVGKTYLFVVEGRRERPKSPEGALFPMPNLLCKLAQMHLPGVPFLVLESPIFNKPFVEESAFRSLSNLS
jgi:hypothetical protein